MSLWAVFMFVAIGGLVLSEVIHAWKIKRLTNDLENLLHQARTECLMLSEDQAEELARILDEVEDPDPDLVAVVRQYRERRGLVVESNPCTESNQEI